LGKPHLSPGRIGLKKLGNFKRKFKHSYFICSKVGCKYPIINKDKEKSMPCHAMARIGDFELACNNLYDNPKVFTCFPG